MLYRMCIVRVVETLTKTFSNFAVALALPTTKEDPVFGVTITLAGCGRLSHVRVVILMPLPMLVAVREC